MCVLCLVVDCGHPGDITNGKVDVSESTLGEWISYSCDEGYFLNGPYLRTCQSNGTWSGNKPTCEGEYHFEWNHKNCRSSVNVCTYSNTHTHGMKFHKEIQ